VAASEVPAMLMQMTLSSSLFRFIRRSPFGLKITGTLLAKNFLAHFEGFLMETWLAAHGA
jgi:hypothetical protein